MNCFFFGDLSFNKKIKLLYLLDLLQSPHSGGWALLIRQFQIRFQFLLPEALLFFSDLILDGFDDLLFLIETGRVWLVRF